MDDYRDDANMQNDEDLGRLEDAKDKEGDERPRSKATDPRELPRPLYRIKATHSNETFYAYFPKAKSAPPSAGQPEPTMPEPILAPVSAEADAGENGGEARPSEAASATAEEGEAPPPIEASTQGTALLAPRTMVVVPTRYGRDVCELQGVMSDPGQIGKDEIVPIERLATEEDLRKVEANRERENKAFETCKQKIAARNLPMKLVSAHYLLEEPKVLFYFSAESRVDFRELVKDLVAVFKIRIELRQIGVRDEARVTGGCGVCGRVLCCHGVTDKLVPVSIKMAKDQNLSLNSMKISGPCGRLLCCLAYEYGLYRDARRELPNEGARFQYDGVQFRVIEVNALSESVKMAGEDGRLLDMPSSSFVYAEGRWHVKEGVKIEAKEEEQGKAE
jgi:cell fate regulator YaaT (PSP1 superfamily)